MSTATWIDSSLVMIIEQRALCVSGFDQMFYYSRRCIFGNENQDYPTSFLVFRYFFGDLPGAKTPRRHREYYDCSENCKILHHMKHSDQWAQGGEREYIIHATAFAMPRAAGCRQVQVHGSSNYVRAATKNEQRSWVAVAFLQNRQSHAGKEGNCGRAGIYIICTEVPRIWVDL
jgi:hypothetical protein